MKVLCSVLSLALLGQCLSMVPLSRRESRRQPQGRAIRMQTINISPQAMKVGIDLCPTCISFTGQAINELLNIILNAGVVGTCGTLCGLLAQATHSQVLGTVCSLLCDIVGIEEFIKLIEKADLDPIYFCELLKVCPINDNGDAKVTSLSVTPKSGPQGVFEIDLAYTSKNGTGTGEIAVGINTQDHLPLGSSFLRPAQPAGDYGAKITVKAEPDPNCDPTQGPCEEWLPGNYTVIVDVCNGECGSHHPHSQIYDRAQTNFTITG